MDYVGTVVELGISVTQYVVGNKVWGFLEEKPDERGQIVSTLAEYVAVGPAEISLATQNLSPVDAITLPLCGLTAMNALRQQG